MKKKLLAFLFTICLITSCAFALTACNGNPDNSTGGADGICKGNSCEYTDCFSPDEFLTDSFFAVTDQLGISKMGNYKYGVWAEMNFGHIKTKTTYSANNEEIAYYPNHAVLCKKCGNIKIEDHTFEHVEESNGFSHNLSCTKCDYTHEASCSLYTEEEECFCGNSKPSYDVVENGDSMRAIIQSTTTGDIVIPREIGGKIVTTLQLSVSEDFQNQQITSLTIPYTAINGIEIPANNHIERIVISGLTEKEAEEIGAEIEEAHDKFQRGEIDYSEFNQIVQKIEYIIQPHETQDMWLRLIGLSNLKSITMQENHVLGSPVFELLLNNCSSLETIDLDTEFTEIENCQSLTNICAGGITFLDDDESLHPSNLTEVTLYRGGITALPSSVKTITLGENFQTIPYGCFRDNTNIETINGVNVLQIDHQAFWGCTNLKNVNLPNVEVINNNVFYECTSLESIDLSKATQIGHATFAGCTNLKNVILSDNLEAISSELFNNCTSLEEIIIPESVTKLGNATFFNCINLEKIYYNAINAEMDSYAIEFFRMACSNVNGGAQLIIGKNVEKLPDDFTVASDGGYEANAINITTITFEQGSNLKSIGYRAISNLKVTEIALPSSVTEIADYAFYNCFYLENVDFGSLDVSTSILYNCPNYEYEEYENGYYFGKEIIGIKPNTENLVVKEGTKRAVEVDGVQFVYDSKNTLKTVVMPNSIVEWEAPFYDCVELESVTLSSSLTKISNNMFTGCEKLENIVIPEGVLEIGSYAFVRCYNLTSINIPNTVTKIGESAFRDTGLTTLNIPSSVEIIEDNAFWDCAFTSLTLNEGLVSIGYGAFLGSNLPKIVLPSTVRNIGEAAFRATGLWNSDNSCYEFELVLNEGLQVLSERALAGSYIKEIDLPSTLTEIGAQAFDNCDYLTSITLPNNIDTLNAQLFYNCDNLSTIVLPTSLKTIKERVFQNLPKLQSITIPASVETIEDYAFYNCEILEEITILGNVELPSLAIYNCPLYKGQLYNGAYYSGTVLTSLADTSVPFVKIKDGTTEVKQGVFTGLTTLKAVFIPESLTTIQANEFGGCTNLTLAFGGNLMQNIVKMQTWGATKYVNMIAEATDDGWIYTPNDSSGMSQVAGYYGYETVITIPANLGGSTMVSVSGFEGNTSITKVIMGSNVVAISEDAFKNCTALQEVTIGANVYMIGANAFAGCSSLTTVNASGGEFSVYNSFEDIGINPPLASVSVNDAEFLTKLTSTYANKLWFRM